MVKHMSVWCFLITGGDAPTVISATQRLTIAVAAHWLSYEVKMPFEMSALSISVVDYVDFSVDKRSFREVPVSGLSVFID